jgi:shikimate dehydrogenase
MAKNQAQLNSGDEKVLGIIGDPVTQVKSPVVFREYFRRHGINAVMIPLHVGSGDFCRVLEGLRAVKNFAGAVVTIPYKPDAYNLAHKISPMARDTQMANVLAPIGKDRWAADMLDGVGLINALQKRAIATTGLRTLVIGAGGAGTAIAVALQQLGHVASIDIVETDRRRAEILAAKLENADIVDPEPEGYSLIVNASPVGMSSEEIPVNVSRISPGTIVCDAIMEPPQTRFLLEAEKKGCIIVEGKEMLLGQVGPIVRFLGLQGGDTLAGEEG